MYKPKKRRKRRIEPVNWSKEISKGNILKFYNSTDWDIVREKALMRDKFVCQFFVGKYTENDYEPFKIKIETATHVHHIKPISERPDLALDLDNVVSLSHIGHEIIEGRYRGRVYKKRLTKEKW